MQLKIPHKTQQKHFIPLFIPLVFLPFVLFFLLAASAAPGALSPLHRLAVHLELVAGLGHELVQALSGHLGVACVQPGQVLNPELSRFYIIAADSIY